ncbi:ABC transporter ATP-binding protein [Anaerolineales bacterium HSG6]|nr:ABC transporter ATP-binding protein [Anaerolineales bacterium HSG6]
MLDLDITHSLNPYTLKVKLQVGTELLALFGPSGAGKSMTLQSIAGLVQPNEGYIRLNNIPLYDSQNGLNLPPQRRKIGYLMQDYLLFPHLSVAENIGYGLHHQPKSVQQEAVERMLSLIQLTSFAQYRPHQLSGGQKQRVALARALVTHPQILLLDEPFSALDRGTRVELREEVKRWQANLKIPILLVTHDLAEANLLADRIAVYEQGQVLQVGSSAEIMHRPDNLSVARLMGTENFFVATVTAVKPDGLEVMTDRLRLETSAYPFEVGQTVHCCIRPEQIVLLGGRKDGAAYQNLVAVTVVSVTTDNLSFSLRLRLADRPPLHPDQNYDLTVILPLHSYERLQPQVGERWQTSLKPSAIHLVVNRTNEAQ